jgi:hypothetical protein
MGDGADKIERRAYTVSEFADMFSISRKHAYELRARGLVTFKKCGAKTVVLASEVLRFEQEMDEA